MWRFDRIERKPGPDGVALLRIAADSGESRVVALFPSELRIIAVQALQAMEPEPVDV